MPLKAWVKGALDQIIQVCLKQPDLEFAWVGDDAVDPLQQAQTLNILVSAGIKTKEEARADLGLAPEPTLPPVGRGRDQVGKYNHNHDERGQFTTAEGAVEPGSKPPATTAAMETTTAPQSESDTQKPSAAAEKPQTPTAAPVPAPAAPTEALWATLPARAFQAAVQAANEAVVEATRAASSAAEEEVSGTIAKQLVQGAATSAMAVSALATAALVAMTKPTGGVEEGSVPGRPDITYRWAPDETTVTYHVLVDGQWRTLEARQDSTGSFRDAQGNLVATVVHDPGSKPTLATDPAAVDRAIAALPNATGDTASGATPPKDGSSASSGAQQIYVNPDTGQTIVAPAGSDASTLPPGFVPVGSGTLDDPGPSAASDAENSNSPSNAAAAQAPAWQPPPEALAKVPPDWGTPEPTKDGNGYRWSDPRGNKFGGIRIDPGDQKQTNLSQSVDHVIVRSEGKVLGWDGNPISGSIKDDPINAHIPLAIWAQWRYWNKP